MRSALIGSVQSWVGVVLAAGGLCFFSAALPSVAAELSTNLDAAALEVRAPSAWVCPHAANLNGQPSSDQAREDVHWLLYEEQLSVVEKETFHHSVYKVSSIAGVERGANIKVEFDPSFERLAFHWVRLWRGSNHVEQLDKNRMRVIQRENELENLIYSGTKTAFLPLEDVRVGDVIDYAYTTRGENPVYGGRSEASVALQLNQAVERLFVRVSWPVSTRLFMENHGPVPRPTVARLAETLDYSWDLPAVAAAASEEQTPGWYDASAWVQMSEYATWAEVNQWAMTLFKSSEPLSPELLARIAQWRQLSSREEQILGALRFLQDEVRYFGVEIGANAVRPAAPSTVFARRYGDCKDKALLLVTVLRALGIDSFPVLVNTVRGRSLPSLHPTAQVFDHAIVQVRLGEQIYWLDPTDCYQRGGLAAHYLPDYAWGLVVAAQTRALEAIPVSTVVAQTHISEFFQVHSVSEPAQLKVVTIAEGRDAEVLRAYLASTKSEEVVKERMHRYSNLYPQIQFSPPLAVRDDEGCNQVQLTERYSIPGFWTRLENDPRCRADFYPLTVSRCLAAPSDSKRLTPLQLTYPCQVDFRAEVSLPGFWPLDHQVKTVSDGAFFFHKDYQCSGNKIVLQCQYRSLESFVPAERMPPYLRHLNEASGVLSYGILSR